MPKQTFFNLPPSKRDRLTEAAIAEFAEFQFHDASINRIIAKANVSRGSFYQYFEDLEDLYMYIFQIVAEQKEAYIEEHFQTKPQGDIFTVLRNMYQVGLQFAIEHPAYAKIGNHLIKGDNNFKYKVMGEWEEYTKQYMMRLLKQGQKAGFVREDIDMEVAAFLFYQQSLTLTDHYLMESDWFENTDRYMQVIQEMLKIFSQGIGTKQSVEIERVKEEEEGTR